MSAKPIAIVGGGLAGLTLGIGLRRRDIPVTVWEAGHYPRHRVCGEFISGRGQAALARLELLDGLNAAGAIPARTVAFFSPRRSAPVRELSQPAISISRFVLDNYLAAEFRRLGGDLRENQRWTGPETSEGVVLARGRRPQPVANGWRWFGLKVHAKNVPLTADLEMHLSPSSYLGISRLNSGEVNVCGLFRRPVGVSDGRQNWRDAMLGEPGSMRHSRLAGARFDEESFCSVAGLSLDPRRAESSPECSIGDHITMTPPVTGNGMSMAFESAELAIEPLAAYSSGEVDWIAAQKTIARRCDQTFARRLAWAAWLQKLLFASRLQDVVVAILPRSPWVWRLLVNKTR